MSGLGSHTAAGAGVGGECAAPAIVARVHALVAAHDGGDLHRAAARCGVTPAALGGLGGALAVDAAAGRAAAAAVLAAVARGYAVDATWLVTGVEDFHGERLAPAARLEVADLLLAVGQRVLRTRAGAIPAPRRTAYDSPHDEHPPF